MPAETVLQTQITDEDGGYWFVDLDTGRRTSYAKCSKQASCKRRTIPQPYTIIGGEIYVAQSGLGMLDPDDIRTEIVDKCLIFGNTVTSSIHGYKFEDLDGNGLDDNDPRVAGVTIT